MTHPFAPTVQATDVDTLAAGWFARARSGEMSAAEHAVFENWLDANSQHRRAYEQYSMVWTALGDVRDDPRVLQLREGLREDRRRPRHLVTRMAIAACLALFLLFLPRGEQLTPPPSLAGVDQPTVTQFETGIGQVSRIALADGSTVVIDTNSALKTIFDGNHRRVFLERGRAFFHVAHEIRPFIVIGRRVAVRATGTRFVVDLHDGTDVVSMIEGRVVASPATTRSDERPVSLTAGRSLTAGGGGVWSVGSVDVNRERDWLTGQLTFRDATLAEIVSEMNRYSPRKVTFGDAIVPHEKLSAILKSGDVDTLTSAVQDLGIARVSSRNADTIVLSQR